MLALLAVSQPQHEPAIEVAKEAVMDRLLLRDLGLHNDNIGQVLLVDFHAERFGVEVGLSVQTCCRIDDVN